MNSEKLIFEVIAKGRSRARGDISQALKDSGAISEEQYKSLKSRDPHVTGNPIESIQNLFKKTK